VFSGDEPCQNLDHEEFLFLVQSLPWAGFVEKKIQATWLQGCVRIARAARMEK
jgi:hypothetical protein